MIRSYVARTTQGQFDRHTNDHTMPKRKTDELDADNQRRRSQQQLEKEKAKLLSDINEDHDCSRERVAEYSRDRDVILAVLARRSRPPFVTSDPEDPPDVFDGRFPWLLISDGLRDDKQVGMAAIQCHTESYREASEALRSDKDITMSAVKVHGYLLKYAHESLSRDRDVVLAAVKEDANALEYASAELQDDKEIVLAAMRCKNHAGSFFQYASSRLRGDKDCAMAAVSNVGEHLADASAELRSDPDVVLEAIVQSSASFRHASEALRSDKEVALTAVSISYRAIQYVSEELVTDDDILFAALAEGYGTLLNYLNRIESPLMSSIPFVVCLMQRYTGRRGMDEFEEFRAKYIHFWYLCEPLPSLLGTVQDVVETWSTVDTTMSPEDFADRWIDRLWQTELSVSVTFSGFNVSDGILAFVGLDKELQLARRFRRYSPVFSCLLPSRSSLPSDPWWLDRGMDFWTRVEEESGESLSDSSY